MSIKVRFYKGEGRAEYIEYGLSHPPRVGEHVYLDDFVSGHVKRVDWVLGDRFGGVSMDPHIRVILHAH